MSKLARKFGGLKVQNGGAYVVSNGYGRSDSGGLSTILYRILAQRAWRSGFCLQNGDSVPLPTNVGLLREDALGSCFSVMVPALSTKVPNWA